MQYLEEITMQKRTGTSESRGKALVLPYHRMALISVLAVLLGKASIGHVISPFALAYFVVMTELLGKKRSLLATFSLVGAFLTGGVGAAAVLAVDMLTYRLLRKAIFRKKAPDLHFIPFLGGFVDVAIRLAAIGTVWTRYDVALAFAESALVVILSLIFITCLPILIGKDGNRNLKTEQLVSLTILLGSVITGLTDVSVKGVSLLYLVLDYLVLLMGSVGGVGVGCSVAIVLGTLSMLSHAETLANVAILAFSGLLSGILKEAHRLYIALAFVLSMTVLTLTSSTSWITVETSTIATLFAALLFVATPKDWRKQLASYVPGTAEYSVSEQERVRRVHHLLSEKVVELSQVFEELAVTYADTGENQLHSAQQLVDYAVGSVAKTVCEGCARRAKCWEKEGFATYQAIVGTVAKMEENPGARTSMATKELRDRCCRLDSMLGVLRHNLEIIDRDARWIDKIREQKTLVSAQLAGVAGVVRSVATLIDQERETSTHGEEQILHSLEQLGLNVDQVHIVSLESGKVEVEISQPSTGAYENSVRMIAPLLSGIVGENITVSTVTDSDGGPCTSVFTSARLYDVYTAVSSVAKDGRLVSGDTYTATDLGNGRYTVAVSDGMGNGERARRESSAAIELLRKLLKAGFDEQLAIKTVNSTLMLRSRDEMFTTLDMVLIDLYSASAEFLKIGCAPSFIKRGKNVMTVTGANVPIGILQDIEVQSVQRQLAHGDILILVSDGVYDAPQVYDREDWLKRQIENLEVNDPQAIADTLLEAAVRMNHGQIQDDMTVMVAVVQNFQPEWAAIKLPGVVGLRRERDKKRRGA